MSESDPNPAPRVRRPRAAAPEATPAETAATPAAPAAPRTPRAPRVAAPVTPANPTPAPATPTPAPVSATSAFAAPAASTPPPPAPPAAGAPSTSTPPPRRIGVGALVAVAAAAALVGGASGAGIAAWAVASNVSSDSAEAGEPQTITVNSPDDVNVVNAVVAKAGPSVVTIAVSSQSAAGTGSGVILSKDGYVLTNNHVVTLDGASSNGTIEVTTADGHIYQAEVVGTDPIVDLAVIKLVDARGLTPIEFGDVDALDVGDRAVVIGAPLGLSNTVTDGIVSVLDRSIQIASSAVPDDGTDGSEENGGQGPFNFDIPGQQSAPASGTISIPVIQTDAAINPGNSGGALVDDSGRLIGIVVAIASAGGTSTTSGSIGVGFAIPADLAQRVATELIDSGTATHGLLGATVRDASSADGSVVGAVIDSVTDGGAGAAVGLRKGDVVTSFGGAPISGSVDLTAQVRRHPAGDEAELVYVRGGEEHTVTVTLGEYLAQ
jgi:putative serine protease PepD